MKPLKTKIRITVDEDVLNEIKKLAEDDDRSLSQCINLILKSFIKDNKKIIYFKKFQKLFEL